MLQLFRNENATKLNNEILLEISPTYKRVTIERVFKPEIESALWKVYSGLNQEHSPFTIWFNSLEAAEEACKKLQLTIQVIKHSKEWDEEISPLTQYFNLQFKKPSLDEQIEEGIEALKTPKIHFEEILQGAWDSFNPPTT
jgi:hypothetical protein